MPRQIHIYRAVAPSIEDAIKKVQNRIRQQAYGDSEVGSPQVLAVYCAETGASVGDLSSIFPSPPTANDILNYAKEIRFAQICDDVEDTHAHWRDLTTDHWEKLVADKAAAKEFVSTVSSMADERRFLIPTMQKIINNMEKGLSGSVHLLEQLSDSRENYPFTGSGNFSNNRLWDIRMLLDKGTVFYAFAMINQ